MPARAARTTPALRFRLEGVDLTPTALRAQARRWLKEDRADRDLTSRLVVPAHLRATGTVEAQERGTLSGLIPAIALARSRGLEVRALARDGDTVHRGQAVLHVTGNARSLLSCERTILNVLMHLSGVATATHAAVQAAARSRRPIVVAATRKTLPGLRDVEKAAVVHGGGDPHRRDLSSAVLVKNNHLALVPLPELMHRLRKASRRGTTVIVEARSLGEARRAIQGGADRVLLDNQSPSQVRSILRALAREGLRDRVVVEVSGGIHAGNVAAYARAGADVASLGALTHSAPALPFHMTLRPAARSDRS